MLSITTTKPFNMRLDVAADLLRQNKLNKEDKVHLPDGDIALAQYLAYAEHRHQLLLNLIQAIDSTSQRLETMSIPDPDHKALIAMLDKTSNAICEQMVKFQQ